MPFKNGQQQHPSELQLMLTSDKKQECKKQEKKKG